MRPPAPPPSEPWETVVDDPDVGRVRLTGRLHRGRDPAKALVVVIHGLGGCVDSGYVVRVAGSLLTAGLDCLRLNLRGSDRLGEDYYHAGLTADLVAAVASPELAGYDTIHLLGYSMGGHVALRYGTLRGEADGDGARVDPRVGAVAAVCAPLHLGATGRVIDRPAFWPYRRYLLGNLLEIYRAVAARRTVPIPVSEAAKIRRFQEWDERIVAPRYGFGGALDYYDRASVGSRLGRLAVPSLLIAGEDDPMVPAHTVLPALEAIETDLRVEWMPAGGHIAFAEDLDARLVSWFLESDL